MKRAKDSTVISMIMNTATYNMYMDRMLNIVLSTIEWKNLPDTMDARWLEWCLLNNGSALLFKDEVMGFVNTQCTLSGGFDIYNVPVKRYAYANNGYHKNLTRDDSVIVYENMLHTTMLADLKLFALRLYNLDRIIDVNANAQKTPVLIACDENERLTMENLYMQFDGNKPVISGRKGLSKDALQVLKTDAPFISDKIYDLKSKIWNEFLTMIGVSNVSVSKRANLQTDEVERQMGGTMANRYSRITSRKQSAEMFNRMFGTNIDVVFREPKGDAEIPIEREEIIEDE